ncbi:MAG: NAD-dependent epimerase/dehydratase family protein [Armatimonadota bacterium]|nr:NAD-dependent epimerase/dehydratase family protein [Armatimonadota bacterium]
MDKVLITGGAGFLGYHLAHHFAAKGVQVALLDIAPYEESEYPAGTEFYTGDVRNREQVRVVLEKVQPRWVIHGAAALPLWKRADIFSTNVEGTRIMLEEAFRAGVERVAHVSSTAVYGIPRKHPIEETDPLSGVGPYGESKILAERICEEFRAKGYIVPVIRPKTFIGQARLGVFQILYDWVESGARIPMIGSGRNRYQLLEVTDLAEAYWLVCTVDPAKANDTFNIGAERFQTVREDLQALCDFAGSGARPMSTPAGLVKFILRILEALKLSPLYKWVYETADKDSFVSVAKAKEKLGWGARYSNAEALIRSYEWYLEHASGLEVSTGVTHRVAWEQGALKLFKWLLGGRRRARRAVPA